MDLVDNPILREVFEIIGALPADAHFGWSATIHANGLDMQPYRVDGIDINRDYLNHFADEIFLQLSVMAGDFNKFVFANRENLEITLTRTPENELGGSGLADQSEHKQRFRAVLLDQNNPEIEAVDTNQSNREVMNQERIHTFEVQLLDFVSEKFRLMYTGGIFRNVTTTDVAKYLMKSVSDRINVDDQYKVRGVDVAPTNSREVFNHIVVPHYTRAIEIPEFLQQDSGIYTTGCTHYLQDQIWYIFPPFNIKLHEADNKLLTIVSLPERMMPGLDRTYREKDGNVYITSTSGVVHRDDSDTRQLDLGNGIRFINADNIVGGFGEVDNNRYIVDRAQNVMEAQTNRRATNLDHITTPDVRITSNHHAQFSKIARNNGAMVQVTWEHANHRLIHPGMATRLLYMENESIVQAYGVVLAVEYYVQYKGTTRVEGRYVTTAAITLFIQRQPQPLGE